MGALVRRHKVPATMIVALCLALALGWAVATSTTVALGLIAMILLGAVYLTAPAAWISSGSLVIVTLCAVLAPTNATEGLFVLGPLSGTLLLAFISVGLTGLTVLKIGSGPILRGGRLTTLVSLFLLVFLVISVATGPTGDLAFLGRWSIWVSAFVLATYIPRRFIPAMISAWIGLAFVEAAYAIYENLAVPPLLYEGYLSEDYLFAMTATAGGGVTRARATFGHPIPLATFLAAACALALFAVRFPAGKLNVLRIAVVITLAGGMLATFSRSSWIALAIALGVGLLSPQISNLVRFRVLMVLGVGTVIFLQTPLGASALDYLLNSEGTVSYEQRAASLQSIPTILDAGWLTVLLGIGAGSQQSLYSVVDLLSVDGLQVVDNQYITLLIETGLLGLGIFLAVILTALRLAWASSSVTASLPDARLVWGIGIALLATLVTIFFYEGLSWPSTAVLVWAMLGFLAQYERELVSPPVQRMVAGSRSEGLTTGETPSLKTSPSG